jgi:hypothetical protein
MESVANNMLYVLIHPRRRCRRVQSDDSPSLRLGRMLSITHRSGFTPASRTGPSGHSCFRASHLYAIGIFLFVILILMFLLTGRADADEFEDFLFEIDLERMAEMLAARYYMSEKGEVPIRYILLGGLGLRSNFLESDFDTRERIVEYDDETGCMYTFLVPSHIRFVRRSDREGAFYRYTMRPVGIEGIDISIFTLDESIRRLRRQSLREVILEDVRYNLRRERQEQAGRGLLSLDIPIPLPKRVEQIIGRGEESNLTVQGRESITIGGQSNWCANCPLTELRPTVRKFPDLEMEQRLTVNLHGNIGEKINVEIQHSSQGELQSVNRVRLNYKGFDDEVIKLIEMGDTDLILSGAQLINYSGSAKGLFGIKGVAQVGPLDLTVIASKEEGETATGSYSAAGGQSMQYEIADYDFIKRQFFYFESPGESFTDPQTTFFTVRPIIGGVGNDEVEVFVSLRYPSEWDYTGDAQWNIDAYPDPENNGLWDTLGVAEGGMRWEGRFRELTLENGDFQLIQDYTEEGVPVFLGIRLTQRLDDDRALAIRYKARNGQTGNEFVVGDYGDFSATKTHKAELICPGNDEFGPDSLSSPYPSTWNMMMRNVYSLGASSMDEGTVDIRIEDVSNRPNPDIHEESGISYIRLFGLDRFDRRGEPIKDERVDDLPQVVNLTYGYIMFPWYEAFNPPYEVMTTTSWFDPPFIDLGDTLESRFDYATLARDSMIYNSVMTETVKREGHHYNIIIEATSGQRTFQLSAYEIIEGSEVVAVDGVKLSRGTDYVIDYISGSVTLMGDILTEMTPDSRVSIDYQRKPLIGGGRNSLLGIGADLNLSTHSRLNATFLYNAVGASKYVPRLGEEPVRTMAADLNGNFQFNPRWMTSLINVLPRVDTDAESSLNISGEVAVSIPNPNIKGEAFIDDMEGIDDSDMISMVRRAWYQASPPVDSLDIFSKLPSNAQSRFYWFNVNREKQEPLITTRRDLNPSLDPRENSTVTSMFVRPIEPEYDEWCGVMTGFAGGGLDLTTAQYIEIWVNDFDTTSVAANRGGLLHIDFGKIDEDFHQPDSTTSDGRSIWNDEDLPPYTWTIEEDTGFRGDTCSYPIDFESDPVKQLMTWEGINCRRGNGFHDTEDLNSNGRLDTVNAYYTLELSLSEEAIIDVQRDFGKSAYADYWNEDTGENYSKAWRMYRVDLSKAKLVSPSGVEPRWDAIQHMRMWISDLDDLGRPDNSYGTVLEIAEVKLVGNRWEFNGIRNLDGTLPALYRDPLQKLTLGTINNKDNPSIYTPPYDVLEEEGLTNREQSLLLGYEFFADSTSFQAVKRFFGAGQDFQNYRQLRFYLHQDFSSIGCEFYLQFAYDSTNYYEIAVPLEERNANKWILVSMNLNDLSSLKLLPADEDGIVTGEIYDNVETSRAYRAMLRGVPTLFRVKYLFIGMRNATGELIEGGEIWINDLKLGEVRKDIDHAERASFSADFGNVLQLSGNWQRTGPEFRTLRQKNGSGLTTSNISLQGKTKVNSFIPTAGFELPITMKYADSKQLPKYIPQSDIEITDDAIRDREKTVSTNYAFTVSMSRRGSSNVLMRHLFDKLRTSFSYSKRGIQSPSSRDTTWTMSGNLNYTTNFSKSRQIGLPKGIRWRYWLSNFSIQSSGSRKTREWYTMTGDELVKRPRTFDAQLSTNTSMLYEPLESIKIDFAASERRDASVKHEFLGVPIGIQTNFSHNLKMQFQPAGHLFLIAEFNPRFQYSTRYTEDLNPNLRQENDPLGTRNASMNRNMNFVFDVDMGKYVLAFGRKLKLVEREEKAERRSGRRDSFFKPPGKQEFEDRMEEYRKQQERQEQRAPRSAPESVEDSEVEAREQRLREAAEEKEKAAELDALAARRTLDRTVGDKEEKPAAAVDSVAAPADTAAAGKRDPLLIVKHALKLLGRFDPIKTNINIDHNSSYQRIYERASLLYQLGFSDNTGVLGKSGEIEDEPERSTNDFSLSFRSAVDLTSNIHLDMRLSYAKRNENYAGRISESDRLTWPSVNMSWTGLERISLLQGVIERSDITMNFEKTTLQDARREEITTSLSPTWNFTWKNDLTTNVSFAFRQTTKNEQGQEIWTRTWSLNMNARYNFKGSRGIGLPLPFLNKKRLKFQSTLTTDVNVGYSSTSRYNQPPSNTLSIAPTASYKFSKRMQGSLAINYRRSAGGIYGYINHSIGVHVTADFTF